MLNKKNKDLMSGHYLTRFIVIIDNSLMPVITILRNKSHNVAVLLS